MKHTKMELKRLGVKTVASKPLVGPFGTRKKYAIDRFMEVFEGSAKHTWDDDSDDNDGDGIKMEILSFHGRNVDAFGERFCRYWVPRQRTKAKSPVKASRTKIYRTAFQKS